MEDGLDEMQRVEPGLKVDLVDGVELFECMMGLAAAGVMMIFPCPRRTGSFVE